jgi:hypothetical protein
MEFFDKVNMAFFSSWLNLILKNYIFQCMYSYLYNFFDAVKFNQEKKGFHVS